MNGFVRRDTYSFFFGVFSLLSRFVFGFMLPFEASWSFLPHILHPVSSILLVRVSVGWEAGILVCEFYFLFFIFCWEVWWNLFLLIDITHSFSPRRCWELWTAHRRRSRCHRSHLSLSLPPLPSLFAYQASKLRLDLDPPSTRAMAWASCIFCYGFGCVIFLFGDMLWLLANRLFCIRFIFCATLSYHLLDSYTTFWVGFFASPLGLNLSSFELSTSFLAFPLTLWNVFSVSISTCSILFSFWCIPKFIFFSEYNRPSHSSFHLTTLQSISPCNSRVLLFPTKEYLLATAIIHPFTPTPTPPDCFFFVVDMSLCVVHQPRVPFFFFPFLGFSLFPISSYIVICHYHRTCRQ